MTQHLGATYRPPGHYNGPLARRLAREELSLPAKDLRAGDRLVEFDGLMVVRYVEPSSPGRVAVVINSEVEFDLAEDSLISVRRSER